MFIQLIAHAVSHNLCLATLQLFLHVNVPLYYLFLSSSYPAFRYSTLGMAARMVHETALAASSLAHQGQWLKLSHNNPS